MSTIGLLRALLQPIVQRELVPRFDHTQIAALIDETFASYERQRPDIPQEKSAGGRLMVRLAALTIGLYRALEARGVDVEDAHAMTAKVTASVYDKMAAVPTVLSRIGTSSPHARLQRATDLFRRFPFSPPSYRMIDVQAEPDVVAFDVKRCPVAEYFRAHGLGELCVASWCNLDFSLARRWGARLERPSTLAAGADHCDFRWRVVSEPSARA